LIIWPILGGKGIDVGVLDLTFSTDAGFGYPVRFEKNGSSIDRVTVRNLDDSYLASQDFCLERTKRIIDLINPIPEPCWFWGGWVLHCSRSVLDYCQVDFGIFGEGEEALPCWPGK